MIPADLQGIEQNPDAAARRLIQRAHNRDGLPEIAVGIAFLTTATIIWPQVALQPGSFWYAMSPWGMILLIALVSGGSGWLIRIVRQRFLIGRQGYVKRKPISRKQFLLINGIALAVAAAGASVAYRGSFPPDSWLLGVTGIFGGAIAACAGRLPRFVVGGAIMAALGISLGLCRVSFGMGYLILFGLMGALSLASGSVRLACFMRKLDETDE